MTSTAPSPSSDTIRRIETDADVAEGAAWLATHDPRLAAALDLTGPLPLRRRADGFRALLGAIVSQQVSVASANAIVARCEAADLHNPDVVRTATSLGHADVFAPNDLALQEGARMLLDLPERPKEREMRVIAEQWSPWRAVAARLLWAYYAEAKKREGIR